MLFTVFLQITSSGLTSSTFGSFTAFWKRASLDIFIPGAIVPPRYSFFSEIAQNVVAVPKSTITHGAPYLCMHATIHYPVSSDLPWIVILYIDSGLNSRTYDKRFL